MLGAADKEGELGRVGQGPKGGLAHRGEAGTGDTPVLPPGRLNGLLCSSAQARPGKYCATSGFRTVKGLAVPGSRRRNQSEAWKNQVWGLRELACRRRAAQEGRTLESSSPGWRHEERPRCVDTEMILWHSGSQASARESLKPPA